MSEGKKLVGTCLVTILVTLLTACGSVAKKPVEVATPESRPAATAKAKPALPATGPKGGGYYLDDGPGDNPPDLDAIPDAIPRAEPPHRFANRPYTVMGRTYTPMPSSSAYRAEGVASWYGRRYHGQKTSSGEIYDMYGMTAAHPILPIPSYARVTNPANGRSVVVRVNDRGPFRHDRLIDLSYTAAYKLDLLRGGSGSVVVESLDPASYTAPTTMTEAPRPEPVTEVPAVPVSGDTGGYYLQLGAFGQQDNAESFRNKIALLMGEQAGQLAIHARDGMFRVQLGPYPNQNDARHAETRVRQSLGIKPLVTQRQYP